MSYKHGEEEVSETVTVSIWTDMYKVAMGESVNGSLDIVFYSSNVTARNGKEKVHETSKARHNIDPSHRFDIRNKDGEVVGSMTAKKLWQATESLFGDLESGGK